MLFAFSFQTVGVPARARKKSWMDMIKNGEEMAKDFSRRPGIGASLVTSAAVGLIALWSTGALSQERASSDVLEVDFIRAADLIWKDSGSGADADVSFWRPTPASGFYAVGDHAKLGHDAPAQGILVVREKRNGILVPPTGYTKIWDDSGSGADWDGSIWRPECPAGYAALGHVANRSHGAPSTEAVRCVSDQVLSRANPGGSIWNDAGSGADDDFSAWSIRPPAEDQGFRYVTRGLFYSVGDSHAQPDPSQTSVLWAIKLPVSGAAGTASDGSDSGSVAVADMRLSSDELLFDFIAHFDRVWSDHGSGADQDVAFYRPKPTDGYYALGHLAAASYDAPTDNDLMMVVKEKTPGSDALAAPLNYDPVWTDSGSGADDDVAVWWPSCPSGYVALGALATSGAKPDTEAVRCVRETLTVQAGLQTGPSEDGKAGEPTPIWTDRGSGADRDFAAWAVKPNRAPEGEAYVAPGSFVAVAGYDPAGAVRHARALRMKLPVLSASHRPTVPVLNGFGPPSDFAGVSTTREILLPFTAVDDPSWSQGRMAVESPFYRLIRTDRYRLLKHFHNTSSAADTVHVDFSTAITNHEQFTHETGIALTSEFEQKDALGLARVMVSVTIHYSFAYQYGTSTTESTTHRIPLTVVPGTAAAAYAIESTFQLHRADGTPVGPSAKRMDLSSIVKVQYPAHESGPEPIAAMPARG